MDGTQCAVKVASTVWRRGKGRDNFKSLPIPIGQETVDGMVGLFLDMT